MATDRSGMFGAFTRRDNWQVTDYFPVYDMLQNQISTCEDCNVPLNNDEIVILTEKLKKVDDIGKHMIYVFIRLHSLRHSDFQLLKLPYGGTISNQSTDVSGEIQADLKFDLQNFPAILCRMLDRFTTLHLRRMEEENSKKQFK